MNIYDIIGMQNPTSGLYQDDPLQGVLPFRLPRRRQTIADMLPQHDQAAEDSLLSDAAGAVGSGLSVLGNVLDTPGAFVRGLLAGENPFPGIFDPEQRVSGRDLLESYGLLGSNQEGLDFGDVAGFGAEVLADPLTYLTFGGSALTKAGQSAAKAGKLAEATYGAGGALLKGARQAGMEAGQRGLVGIGLPFMDPFATIGHGATAQKIAGGLDKVGDALRFGTVPGTGLSPGLLGGALFDADQRGALTRAGAVEMKSLSKELRAAKAGAREGIYGIAKKLRDEGLLTDSQEEANAYYRYLETGQALPEEFAKAAPALDELKQVFPDLRNRALMAGLPLEELEDDFVQYATRQQPFFPEQPTIGPQKKQAFPTKFKFQEQREKILKNIPGGTAKINEMSLDPMLAGEKALDEKAASQYILNKYLGADPEKIKQAESLADYMRNLSPLYQQKGIGLFGTNPVANALRYAETLETSIKGAEGVYGFIGKNLVPDGPGAVAVDDVLQQAGLKKTMGAGAFIPAEIAGDVQRVMKSFANPEEVGTLGKILDTFTNTFKAGVTTRPAFHVRNFYSGQYMNMVSGLMNPESLLAANKMLRGEKTVEGMAKFFPGKNLTDEAATELVRSLAFKHNLVSGHAGMHSEVLGAEAGASKLANEIIGDTPFKGIGKTLWDAVPKSKKQANPLNQRGLLTEGDVFAPVAASRSMGNYVEGMNRLAPFIEALKQGYDDAVAAAKVNAIHVDYAKLSQFEKTVMRRAVPFYTFLRGIAPEIMREFIERPGGRMAQTLRATNNSRDDSFLPPHVAQGAAIPIPFGEPEGYSRYLTGTDLPFEPVLNMLRPGATVTETLENTGAGVLGNLNPLFKAPLEVVFGKQLYSGRDMTELDSRIGRTTQALLGLEQPPEVPMLLDQALANSPLAGISAMLGTAVDPRKGAGAKAFNLLSGAKVTDVDTGLARDRAAQEYISRLVEENPKFRSFEQFYVPRDQIESLSDEEKESLALYRLVAERFKQRAKEKRGAGSL